MSATLDHFEIPVVSSERLAEFLEVVFGWPLEDRTDASGSEGGSYCRVLTRGEELDASSTAVRVGLYEGPRKVLDRAQPVVRLSGEALESCLDRVTSAGGRVVFGPEAVGDTGRFARFEDPEGNPWGLWQPSGASASSA